MPVTNRQRKGKKYSSEDRFKENLSFFQAMVSEITNKKNKSKSHTKTNAKNLDVKLEDIQ